MSLSFFSAHLRQLALERLLAVALQVTPRSVPCPRCRRVSTSSRDREQAVRELVRPYEVADLFVSTPNHRYPPDPSSAGTVSQWLRRQFAAGSLRYLHDPQGQDIWCSPLETRRRGGGDCDDCAILAASMVLYAGGFAQVAIGSYCQGLTCEGHAWVEGSDQNGWFLLEGTSGVLYRHARPERYALRQLV